MSDGSALLLAVEEWLTPAGQAIWHKGITPEIKAELPAEASPILPEDEQNMTAAQLHASKDEQLLRSLELLSPSGVRRALTGQFHERRAVRSVYNASLSRSFWAAPPGALRPLSARHRATTFLPPQ